MTDLELPSPQLFDALLEAAVDGIIVIDESATIRIFNNGAEKLFGYHSEEVVGRNVKVLMNAHHGSRHDGYMDHYMETGERRIIGIGREVTAMKKGGEEFPIDLTVGEAPLGENRVFVGIIRDLSRRVAIEDELIRQRSQVQELERSLAHFHRTSTLGEMAAGIAHEVNQPLAAMTSYADAGQRLLDRDPVPTDKLKHAMNQISRQARRAGEVIMRMRNMARQQDTPQEVHDLNDVVREILQLAELEARASDAPVKVELAPDLPPVLVDPVQIQQVVLNLVRNGLESLVRHSQASHGVLISTRCSEDDGHVELLVVDRGVGVPEADRERIFDPFHSSKPSGMGIGLSICSTIAERHGGSLRYEPNPVGGSRFILSLPPLEE
ncbi:MAG: PAS domain S-box protein [Pseudomonadota bacterium]